MSRPHRILFCSIGYDPGPVGGAERQARLQAEELARRGHRVEVVVPRSSGTRSEVLGGVLVRRLPRIDRRPLRTVSYLPILFAWLVLHMRRYDVIHIHLANLQADVAGVAHAIRGVPLYIKLAAGGPRGEIGRMRKVAWATHFIGLRSAQRIQAISPEIADEVAALGIPSTRVVRIPNGIRTDVYRPVSREERVQARRRLALPENEILVLFAGRFARYKGIDDLLAAWSEASTPSNSHLVLVGEQALDAPLGKLRETERAIVRPWTSRVIDYFHAADAYVHPSHADGMPNVVLEAMACGLPVIATKVAAVPTMIEDGVTGRLVDIGAVDQLRKAIEELVADPRTRRRLGEAAARIIPETYGIERVVDSIEREYDAILAEVR